MARILIAFYNCISDEQNPKAMPIFYESFINGLDKAGNDIFMVPHNFFGINFGNIEGDMKRCILDFQPDICFLFNNSFYDLAEVVDCPIVIFEVDSPRYFSNKKEIKSHPDRYLYFIIQQDSRKILMEEFSVPEKNIFFVSLFSEVYADVNTPKIANISFIGSMVATTSAEPVRYFCKNAVSDEEWEMFANCINDIRNNPQVSPTELVYRHRVTSETVARSLNIPDILQTLSTEKRIAVLAAVAELGLDLYGTENWATEYYYNSQLNFCYKKKMVYSVEHNTSIYNQSLIGINVSHLQATSGFPWRVMDIMASSACLVTDYHSDFKACFPEVADIIPVYTNPYEAYSMCKALLEDDRKRNEIVLRCNEVIDARYRFKHILAKLEEYSGVKMHQEESACVKVREKQ